MSAQTPALSRLPVIKRRGFLKSTAALVGGGLALAHNSDVLGADPTPKPYKKAVKIGMVQTPGSLTEKFQLLKDLGFDGVELNSPGGPSPDEVAKAKKATGLDVHGVVDSRHWKSPLSHADPTVRERGLAALTTAIRDAKAYGASSVLLVPAVLREENGKKSPSYEDAWKRSIAEIKKALPIAEEQGIDILLENVWNNFLTDPKETARYIDELGSKRIGAYFDVGNAVRYSPPAKWVPILGQRIKKLDIKEYDLTKGKKEGLYKGFQAPLLEGECDWPAVLKELRKIKFQGWGTAEIPGGNAKRLAEIAKRMNRIFSS